MIMKRAGVVLVVLLLVGCAPRGMPPERGVELEKLDAEVTRAPVNAPEGRGGRRNEGSLWGPGQRGMFVDNKAREVGDIITVQLDESRQGENAASIQASREISTSGGVSSFLGLEKKIPGEDPGNALDANASNELNGAGENSRSGSLSGNMTAVVKQVLPNGNMRIEGRRQVAVDNERQDMVLSGVVRREDLRPDNSIPSSQVANARIRYTGEGAIARQQDEGWLAKILHKFWPF